MFEFQTLKLAVWVGGCGEGGDVGENVALLPKIPPNFSGGLGVGGRVNYFNFMGKFMKNKKKKTSKTNPLGQVGGFKPHFQKSWMRS